MSLHEYQVSIAVSREDYPFYALIMAATRGADPDNLDKLRAAWPERWAELQARYHAPAGMFPDEMQRFKEANAQQPRYGPSGPRID